MKNKLNKFAKNLEGNSISDTDIDLFIIETKYIDIEVSERLKELAIFLEQKFYPDDEKVKWDVLNNIYKRAIEEKPNNFQVYESHGISALNLIEISENKSFKQILFEEAEQSFLTYHKLGNNSPRLQYVWGLLNYTKSPMLALEKFQKAIELESDYDMANMYLGYCYKEYELGRFHSEELNLAYPTEMLKTLKRHKLPEFVIQIESLIK